MFKNQPIVTVLFLQLSLPKTCMLINAFKLVKDIIILTPHNVFIRIGYTFIAQTKFRKVLSLQLGRSMPIQAIPAINTDVVFYLIKTLFILKIKTVTKTNHSVIKIYSSYQIRPDTVDLLLFLLLYNYNSFNSNIYTYCRFFLTKTEH